METLTISVKAREKSTKGALAKIRNSGNIPAIVYGLDKDSQNIMLSMPEMRKYFKESNKNKIVELDIDGSKEQVLVKEIVRHAVKQEVMHVDFLRVNDTRPVVVKVPISHTGVPTGVKNEGGQFAIMKRFVKVKCKVGDIPETFEQDISDLTCGTVVYTQEIKFEKGEIITPPRTALYGVKISRKIEDEEKPTEAEAGEEAQATDGTESEAKESTDAKASDEKAEKTDKK
jgi:large subunit ribosomal protein L25